MSIPQIKRQKHPLFKYPCNYYFLICDDCSDKIKKGEILFKDYSMEPPDTLCEECGKERATMEERPIIERMATDEEI